MEWTDGLPMDLSGYDLRTGNLSVGSSWGLRWMGYIPDHDGAYGMHRRRYRW